MGDGQYQVKAVANDMAWKCQPKLTDFIDCTNFRAHRYSRLLSPRYGDGYSSPTISITGLELPNARTVSLKAFGEVDIPDPQFTLATMQMGQIVTHDMSMLAGSTQSSTFGSSPLFVHGHQFWLIFWSKNFHVEKHKTQCCTDDGKLLQPSPHKTCFPILIPPNDPAHSQTNVECTNFVRTLTDKDIRCFDTVEQNPAEQMTVVSAFMDLSLVYGNNDEQNRPIRAYHSGRL